MPSQNMRERFTEVAADLLDTDERIAVVLAEISAERLTEAGERHPGRVINVGIREQLLVSLAGGLALAGLRPIAHSFASFLVERPFESVKLDFGHQDSGGVLVSSGASYDIPTGGRTHQSPGDVALIDTLPGWRILVPGHAQEAERALRAAARTDERVYLRLSEQANADPHPVEGITVLRSGGRGMVLAVGPVLDRVLQATAGLDLTVAYTATARPLDVATLRAIAERDVLVVEPYLQGTSTHVLAEALADRPRRIAA
ncbi:MAG: transketolase, partial [Sciscionella sp.]